MSQLESQFAPFWLGEPPPATPSCAVPAFNLDEVHRLQTQLFRDAEKVLGPCVHGCTIEPARFVVGLTGLARRVGGVITIHLDRMAAMDWESCVAELGHELVHALDGLTGEPTWLEEGMACAFGVGQAAAMFGRVPMYRAPGAYREALKMVASIPDQFAVVKALRAQGIPMCRVTPQRLMAAAPGIDEVLALKLCERWTCNTTA